MALSADDTTAAAAALTAGNAPPSTLSAAATGTETSVSTPVGPSPAGTPLPALPGAVTRAPAGIGPGAPFDVAAYFAAPPLELNAAPLYLDALLEFDPGMAVCFPENAEIARRKQLADARYRVLRDQSQAVMNNPASVAGAAIDRLVTDLEVGMQKVEEAQRRPRCVFQSGFDDTSLLPHAQAAREVARLAVLRTRRNLDRGNVEQPLRDLGVVFRLARDLRPRGASICQVVAGALTSVGYVHIIRPLLASPKFRERQASQLLEILVEHEAASINGYEEGVRFDYVCMRVAMNSAIKDPRGSIARISHMYNSSGKAFVGENDPRVRDWENEIKKMTPARIDDVNTRVNQYFQDLLALKNAPVSQWLGREPNPQRINDGSFYSKIPALLMPTISTLAESQARIEVQVRAAECLIAIKLWRYRTNELPTDLAAVTKAAGLPRVPLDEYSGQPLRMTLVDGEPVVYSVGKDGRDDGGRIDSDFDRKPGDHLYRLPAIEQGKR
ncbi:MAG: hypothetical protein ACHRXM_16805 [Isosphaerales bacterium]